MARTYRYFDPEIDNMDYMNRKGFYSLVFQAVAIGTTLQFIEFSGGWAGSIGDSSMFKTSTLFKNLCLVVFLISSYWLMLHMGYTLGA